MTRRPTSWKLVVETGAIAAGISLSLAVVDAHRPIHPPQGLDFTHEG
ncbi:hypothetical protein [Rhodococcus globerulus]